MRLSRLFDVMCCNDHGSLATAGNVYQMIPDTLTQHGINTNGGFVQNQQLWLYKYEFDM